MKYSFVVYISLVMCACSSNVGSGSGEADFGSLSEDVTYHNLQEGLTSDSGQSLSLYNKMFLKADGSQFTYESVQVVGGTPTLCKMEGSWSVESGDSTTSSENELVAVVSQFNGNTVSKTVRFPLRNFTTDSLQVQLTEGDSTITDLTNQDLATYAAPDTSSASSDDFCDWQ